MVAGDMQTNEPITAVLTAPPVETVGGNTEIKYSADGSKVESTIVGKMRNNLGLEDHFARLKKRMRSHATSIF